MKRRSPAGRAARHADGPAGAREGATEHRGRRRWLVAGIGALAMVAAALAATDPFRTPATAAGNPYPLATATVTRGALTSQTDVDGTVGDAGSCTLVNQASGEYTALPAAGQQMRQGQVLYQVSGAPVVLLDGTVPAYRTLSAGMTGTDVAELNHDLVTLRYADRADVTAAGWDYFGPDTGYALGQLQQHVGLDPTGTLVLGQAVFAPAPLEITALADNAVLGGAAAPEQAVATASSTTPVVTVALDPGLQTNVKDGDTVSVTLPDGAVTPGVISSIGAASATSASATSGSPSSQGSPSGSSEPSQGSSGSSATGASSGSEPGQVTIPVQVTLTDPKAAAGLDQAPVSVTITTGSVAGALVVPVDALLAQPGGYSVEVTGPGGRRIVPVTPALFDDAAGTVQVTRTRLAAGQRVVVPGA